MAIGAGSGTKDSGGLVAAPATMTSRSRHRWAVDEMIRDDDMHTPATRGATDQDHVPEQHWLSLGLVALGIGLAGHAIVGPVGADLVDYPLSETLRNQTIGLDAVTLTIAAPTAIAAGLLLRRRHRLAPFLAVVVGFYTAYVFLQFVIGPDYLHYPGTLPLQMALFTLGWAIAVRAWTMTATFEVPAMGVTARRRHAAVLLALAGFVVVRYLPALPAALGNEPIPEESLGDPAMFWSIFLMDLGIFVPVVVTAAIALRRGSSWGHRALYVAVGWFVLVTLAVLAMSIAMAVDDDPYASGAQVILFAVTACAVVAYAGRLFSPLATTDIGPAVPSSRPRARAGQSR